MHDELDSLDWNGLSGVWTGVCRISLNEKDIVDILKKQIIREIIVAHSGRGNIVK